MSEQGQASRFTLPLIIRGRIIEGSERAFDARFGAGVRYEMPDLARHLESLTMRDPAAMADVQALPLTEILDYLAALSGRLKFDENQHLQQAFQLARHACPLTASILLHSYRHLPTMFARDVVGEVLETSIGTAHLQGWVDTLLADGTTLSVRAFGARAVHVIAGTGPMVAAMTILRNAVTRGDAIIKLPSNDPATAVAIVRTMIDLDPTHPLTRHVSTAYWRGGDEAIEQRIYDPCFIEKIVAWGGSGSMKHITQYLQPGIELIGFDPKWSATIIGRDAFVSETAMQDAALRLAADIGAYNQVGCANARVAYLETGCDQAGVALANQFGAMVRDCIQLLPETISSTPKQFDQGLKAEIDALTIDHGLYRIFGSPREGIIIVSQTDAPVEFTTILGDRVANLVPIETVDDALHAITYYTQTVGIYPDSLKFALRDTAPLHGAQRLVSLGYACAPPMAGPWDAIEPIRRMCRWVIDQTSDPNITTPLWRAGGHAGFGA